MMRRERLAVALLGLCLACEHTVPYGINAVPANPPLTGSPRQVTFNVEGDWYPAWLPDGSGLGFSYQIPERSDRDRCIAFFPAEGGRIFREVCQRGAREGDSINVVSTHAVSPGGRIALVAESSGPRRLAPARKGLYLGRLGSDSLVQVLSFPYTAPSGLMHSTGAYFTWVNESTLVYLAQLVNYRPPVQQIPGDTVITGIEIVRLDLSGDDTLRLTVIPGTLGASSVALGQGATVYVTMGGETTVQSLDLVTGQRTVVYDFDTLGIARDAQVAGGRLVAVVGGHVRYTPLNQTFGIPQQADSGGAVAAVTLPAGPPQILLPVTPRPRPDDLSYVHLALAPSGRSVAAEAYRYFERHLFVVPDTIINKRTNLFMVDVP